MAVASPIVDQSAQTEQRKNEKLFSVIFIAGGVGSLIASLFDGSDGLFTTWDIYLTPIISILYLVSGVIIYLRPRWLSGAVLLSVIPTMIYQQGVMFMAVHHPSTASLYSAASSGPFFPLLYIGLFIILPKGATTLGWIHCGAFYLQFLFNWLSGNSTTVSIEGEHLLVEIMMAHPTYIIALSYIVRLRERLHATQQESFQSKEQFLSMLSHEIRNQLQTMVGAIEHLDLKLREPGERRSVARLHKAASQLQTYLSDLGELTQLENPALRVKYARFDLSQLLGEIREEWLPIATGKGLQLTLSCDDGLMIESDEARLHQIVSNLVSNALKYTETGSVTLAARINPANSLLLEVRDTGIGIEEKYLGKIFHPYIRLNNPKTPNEQGSGLGLTIVERLIASLNGTLRVESQINQGTKFEITLPGSAIDHPAT